MNTSADNLTASYGNQEYPQGSVVLFSGDFFKIVVDAVRPKGEDDYPSLGVSFSYSSLEGKPFCKIPYAPENQHEIEQAKEAQKKDSSVEIPEEIWPEISDLTIEEISEQWQSQYLEMVKARNSAYYLNLGEVPESISIMTEEGKVTLVFPFFAETTTFGDFCHLYEDLELPEDTSDWEEEDFNSHYKTVEMVRKIRECVPDHMFERFKKYDLYLRSFSTS